jgi:hypothetical protein
MAESLGKEHNATAADRRFGNQRVKPTELLTLRQRFKQGCDLSCGKGGFSLRLATALSRSDLGGSRRSSR